MSTCISGPVCFVNNGQLKEILLVYFHTPPGSGLLVGYGLSSSPMGDNSLSGLWFSGQEAMASQCFLCTFWRICTLCHWSGHATFMFYENILERVFVQNNSWMVLWLKPWSKSLVTTTLSPMWYLELWLLKLLLELAYFNSLLCTLWYEFFIEMAIKYSTSPFTASTYIYHAGGTYQYLPLIKCTVALKACLL